MLPCPVRLARPIRASARKGNSAAHALERCGNAQPDHGPVSATLRDECRSKRFTQVATSASCLECPSVLRRILPM